jgi:DNA-binding GntR family transcriptional regulator
LIRQPIHHKEIGKKSVDIISGFYYTKYNIMEPKVEKLIQSPNLRERVYEVLKRSIIFQEIPPGEKIDEETLASQLGVSRTPIRESLCRLENEGIVKIIPRRGAFVVKHSQERIVEILLLREALEGLAVRLAAENISEATLEELKLLFRDFSESNIRQRSKNYTQADLAFHTLIVNQSKNDLLGSMMKILNDHIQMLRLRTVALEGRPEQSLTEHLKIIEALEKRNPSLAESLMREHIQKIRESVLRNFGNE